MNYNNKVIEYPEKYTEWRKKQSQKLYTTWFYLFNILEMKKIAVMENRLVLTRSWGWEQEVGPVGMEMFWILILSVQILLVTLYAGFVR